MRILVDQDEVLAHLVKKVVLRWNAECGTFFQRDEINMWKMEDVLGRHSDGRGGGDVINGWFAEEGFFEDLEPLAGAIAGFNELRARGHDVVLVTSVPEVAVNAYTGKRRWMRAMFPDWSMKNFVACSRKGLVRGDVLVDDGIHNINEWCSANPGLPAIVFRAPWNESEPLPPSAFPVHTWEEVVRLVDAIQSWRGGLFAQYP